MNLAEGSKNPPQFLLMSFKTKCTITTTKKIPISKWISSDLFKYANLKIHSRGVPSASNKHEETLKETLKIEKVQTEHNGSL